MEYSRLSAGLRTIVSKAMSLAKTGSNKPVSVLPKTKDKQRVSQKLKRQKQYLIEIGQDELKLASLQAEDYYYPNRLTLYYIYKETLRDLHLRSQIRTGFIEVTSEPWVIVDKKTKEINVRMTEFLEKKWFKDVCKYFLEEEFWGHSLIEFGVMKETEPENRDLAPYEFETVKIIPREHVRPETGEILIDPNDMSGIPYREAPMNSWLIEVGDPDNLGLLEIIARYGIYKKFTLSDWSRSSEKWSDPILVLKSASDNETEVDKKEEMAANFGNNSYAIFDIEDEVELMERSNGAGYKIFFDFLSFLNDEVSKGVNGQTGTSDQKAFVGAAEVHERILNGYSKDRLTNMYYFHNDKTIPFLISKGYKLEGMQWMPLRMLNEKKKGTDPNADPNADPNIDPNNDPKNNQGSKDQKPKPQNGNGGAAPKK